MGVIYVRPNLINGKKYVGQATDLKKRQNDWKCLTQKYAGPAINAARAKYGIDNFGFEILKECKDDELDYWEKYYIKELNTKAPYGYNLTDGGGGMSGYTLSEETRKKMSEIQKGKNNGFYGKNHTDEAKKKIGEAQKGEKNHMYGKHWSEEAKKKLSDARKGKTPWNKGKTNIYSDEAKKKMSDSKKGKKLSEEHKKKLSESHLNGKYSKIVLQIDKETNETISEFPSTMEVERQLGFNHSSISACCKGKLKTSYGYIWKYKEESAA